MTVRRWGGPQKVGFSNYESSSFWGGGHIGAEASFAAVRDYVLIGAIKPLRAATYPLNEIKKALEVYKGKKSTGKLVIVVD